jgi:ribokinase
MPDVIVMGDINVDVFFSTPAYPRPGSDAIASDLQMHTGGSAVNTAIALSKMEMEVGFIGRVGPDPLAKQVLRDLQQAGVDCSQVQIDPKVSTGLIFIAVTEDGERTMFSARGANAFTDARAINPDYFASCRWVHLSGYSFLSYQQYETMLFALDLAENSPYTRVSLDIGTEAALRARPQIIQMLPRLDVILPSELELSILSGASSMDEGLDYLLARHAKAIVTKLGRKGCIVALSDKRLLVPAFEIEVKNSTGAGDSFNAGLVLGRLVGLSWEAAVALGNALGGLTASFEGSGAKMLSRAAVTKLVERHLFRTEWAATRLALEELAVYFEEGID